MEKLSIEKNLTEEEKQRLSQILSELFVYLKEEDKTERFTDKRRRFACKWIVGTGEMLEWGPSYDVVRPSKRDVSLTFHVYRHGDRGRKSLMKEVRK